jgi:hypothetical protein
MFSKYNAKLRKCQLVEQLGSSDKAARYLCSATSFQIDASIGRAPYPTHVKVALAATPLAVAIALFCRAAAPILR